MKSSAQRGALVCRLSDDLVLHVFSYLHPRMVCMMRAVNRRFHEIASEEVLWEELLRREIGAGNMPTAWLNDDVSWRMRFANWRRLDSCSCKVGEGSDDDAEAPQVQSPPTAFLSELSCGLL